MAHWEIGGNVIIKLMNGEHPKVAFRRRMKNGSYRGITLPGDSFKRIVDVTITPGLSLDLESGVTLVNYGNQIKFTKYCFSSDETRCDGAFILFNEMEWQCFMRKYADILEQLNK